MLNEEHKNNRMAASIEDMHCYEDEKISLTENITEDESWVNVVTPKEEACSVTTEVTIVSEEEKNFYHLMFNNDITSVRFRKLHCTACDAHIGSAPSQHHNMFEHPILRTLVCSKCRSFYGDGVFEKGDDATDMFCRWCANGGNLYCCSYCSNTFCYKCIRRNFTALVRKKIEADEKWKCFVCNPRDLYAARAVCWALLQHVHSVARSLKQKYLNIEDFKERMNLDESQCCQRKAKRKTKRKLESNSEEEDVTYIPENEPSRKKPKKAKINNIPKYTIINGTITKQLYTYPVTVPVIQHSSSLSNIQSFKQKNESNSVITQYKPSTNKYEEAIIQPLDSIVPSSSSMSSDDASLNSRFDTNILQSSSYHTIVNNTVTNAYIQAPASTVTHKIIFPQTSSHKQNSYQPSLQSPVNTMVAIPNLTNNHVNVDFLFPYPNKPQEKLTPNIIQLDSDSDDELKIVEQSNNVANTKNTDIVEIISNEVVPIALVSMDSSSNDNLTKTSLKEMSPSFQRQAPTFRETILSHSQELNQFLDNTKENLNSFFNLSGNDEIDDDFELAYENVKRFSQNMRKAVLRLAHINDRIIREYNKWERSRKIETEPSPTDQDMSTHHEDVDISLDMTCVNESDDESDCGGDSEYQIMEPSELVQTGNIVKNLFFKKDVVHRGVGDSALLFEDKTTQVYDVSNDYEKHISCPVLMRTNNESNTSDSTLKHNQTSNETSNETSGEASNEVPNKTTVENFNKYEEQFIFYLQHIENHGIRVEDWEETEDLSGGVEESIIPSPLRILNSLKNINSPATSNDSTKHESNQEEPLESCINSVISDKDDMLGSEMNQSDTEIKQRINSSNTDTKIQILNTQFIEETQETTSQDNQNSTVVTEKSSAVLSDHDTDTNKNFSNSITTKTAVMESEECSEVDN